MSFRQKSNEIGRLRGKNVGRKIGKIVEIPQHQGQRRRGRPHLRFTGLREEGQEQIGGRHEMERDDDEQSTMERTN